MMSVDLSKVTPIANMRGDDDRETLELVKMHDEASAFLKSFRWCLALNDSYHGIGIPGIVGVFLFRIKPAGPEVDDLIWVVVGDLPPAYITTENASTPAAALDGYIGAMEEWVQAARSGLPADKLIPVNVAPTPENARMLQTRLEFLDKEVLSRYASDL